MILRRTVLATLFGALSILASAACGGGGSTSSGSGGSGGGAPKQDAPVVLPPSNGGKSCANGEGSCKDQAAIDAYSSCVITTCDAPYKQCFGNDYLTGTFGGSCKDLMACASACTDCDQVCLKACSDQHFTGDCLACVEGPIFDCVLASIKDGTCTLPCGPSSAGGVCAKLKTCCDSLTGTDKSDCLSTYDQVKIGGDTPCGSALNIYQTSMQCP
jgi:hypothetical protein